MIGAQPSRFTPSGALRAILYRLLWTCAEGLSACSNAFLFASAGLLRKADLQVASLDEWSRVFRSAADVDVGLFPAERQFYPKFLRPGDRVLLVGCGAGRDLLALCSMGYDVVGLEQVPELVDLARAHLARRGLRAVVHTGDIRHAALDGEYDAIIFSLGCYSFLQGSVSRIATLIRVKAHLPKDGRLLFSYRPFVRQSRLGQALRHVSARLARVDWTPEPGDFFTRDPRATGVLRYEHHFWRSAFADECAAAGFRVVADEIQDDVLRYAAAVPAGQDRD